MIERIERKAKIATFAKDFVKDLPPEAASGSYGATDRDRWATERYTAIADGEHTSQGWTFAFRDGVFRGARRT